VASEYKEAHLRQVAVSGEYITYGLKQGHIRVLHRFSQARALLKAHAGPLADLRFLGDDLVASGGQDGQACVWRLRAVDGDNALHATCLLSAKLAPAADAPVLLAGAGAAGGALILAAGNAVLSLALPPADAEQTEELEIDPLSPGPAAHAMPNFPVADSATAVAASPDGALVAAGSKNGRVYVCGLAGGRLQDARPGGGNPAPIHAGAAVSAVAWIAGGEQGHTLLVGSAAGTQHTLHHLAPGAEAFTRGPSVTLCAGAGAPSFIHTGVVAEQRLVLLADTPRKAVYTLHWSGEGAGAAFDYLARFRVGLPILNFFAAWDPDAREEGAVEVNCVQTEAVQQYFLDPALCWDESAAAAAGEEPAAAAAAAPAPAPETPAPAPAAPEPAAAPAEAGPAAALPQRSPPLANGAEAAPAANGGGKKEKGKAAAAAAAAAAAESAPAPAPTVEVAASAAPAPLAIPSPVAPPKLLTPKDLLRASAAAAGTPAAAPDRDAASPAPGSQPQPSIKILQRPTPEAEQPPPAPPSEPGSPAASAAHSADGGAVAAAVADEMSGVHRKFAGHVSSMYRELLKAMKAEMAAQSAAQAAATAAAVREALAAQAAAAAAERAAAVAEERANMERLLGAISATLNRDLPVRLQEALRAELTAVGASLAGSVAPAVQAAVAASLPAGVAAATKAALEQQLPGAVAQGVAKPLGESFKTAFAKQLVPAFEGAAQSMFGQMNAALAAGLEEHLRASRAALAEPTGLAASLRDSLGAAHALAESLRQGQEGLARSAAASASAGGRAPAAPKDARAELRALAAAGRHEEAFSRALGLQDAGTVAWLCAQSDAAALLARDPPALSQMVLLSLVQQLASDLSTGAATKLQWIREAAMVLNPRDPQTGPHLRPVLEQVTAGLKAALAGLKGGDASSCKLAMHVVHSQMTS
jgi:hypothetical protein